MKKKIFFFTNPIDFINVMLYYDSAPVALAGQAPFQ